MSLEDRIRWDERHARAASLRDDPLAPPELFAPFAHLFPRRGSALELACGRGVFSVWLAARGLEVRGVDVSPVAIDHACKLAARHGVAARCTFEVVDLDGGLPPGSPVDVVACHLFWDRRLCAAITERLAPGGLLAVAVLGEVGGAPAPFRAGPGELLEAFAGLHAVAHGEGSGRAWLLARA